MLSSAKLWQDGWRICLNFTIDFADDFCSRRPPHILLFSWRVIFCEYIPVWNSFLVILVSPSLVCLNFLYLITLSLACLNFSGIVRTVFSCVLAQLKFAVLVDPVFILDSKLPCLFPFYFIFLWITSCIFIVLFIYSDFSELDSCYEGLGVECLFSLDLSNVYWCGTGRIYMDD